MARFVTCVCPTLNRHQFLPRAIKCFLGQEYPKKELLIVDDGASALHLIPQDPRIRYINFKGRLKIGEKRNFCNENAIGELIAHWDDDDWSHPRRLGEQIALLGAGKVTGYQSILFHEPKTGQVWKYNGAARYAVGTSLLYRRDYWAANPFRATDPGTNWGEDNNFVHRAFHHITVTDGTGRCVATTHAGNTSPRVTSRREWTAARIADLPDGYEVCS